VRVTARRQLRLPHDRGRVDAQERAGPLDDAGHPVRTTKPPYTGSGDVKTTAAAAWCAQVVSRRRSPKITGV
jgi:hypothetical protein